MIGADRGCRDLAKVGELRFETFDVETNNAPT
jgi:hypothetical protein